MTAPTHRRPEATSAESLQARTSAHTFSAGQRAELLEHAEVVEKRDKDPAQKHEILIRLSDVRDFTLRGVSLEVGRGEIVGLAGLEGSGQRQVLRSIFSRRNRGTGTIEVSGTAAFVSGDRIAEGIFPEWPIDDNIAISAVNRLSRWGFISLEKLQAVAAQWFRQLQVRAPSGIPAAEAKKRRRRRSAHAGRDREQG